MGKTYFVAALRTVAAIALLPSLTACPGTLDNIEQFLGDGGALPDAGTPDSGVDPCDYVVADILSSPQSCASAVCHDADTPSNQLNLAAPDIIGRLRDQTPVDPDCSDELLIDSANPENSLLFTILTDPPPCTVSTMPLIPPPLANEDIACILTWIRNGLGTETGTVTMPNPQRIFIEAEDATIRSPFATVTDAAASGGTYVTQDAFAGMPPNQDPDDMTVGLLTFEFNLQAGGQTQIWTRVRGATIDNNSFWARVDGGNWIRFNDFTTGEATFTWDRLHDSDNIDGNNDPIPVEPTLAAGTHTIEFAFREIDAQIDRVLVSQDLMFTPTE